MLHMVLREATPEAPGDLEVTWLEAEAMTMDAPK